MQEQGGAIANVQEVRIVSIKPTLDNPESLDCKWNVTGTVEHWGHIHTRENQYSARIKLDVSEKVAAASQSLKSQMKAGAI